MKPLLTATLCALCLALPAKSDPQADIDYIVSQTHTRTIFEGAIQAQRPVLISAIENNLRQQGLRVSDMNAFFDLFMDEWIETFTDSMQAQAGPLYRDLFTDQELADIAAFYRTDSGQALLQKTPQLMQAGVTLGQKAGLKTGRDVLPRLVERMRSENIVIESPSMTKRLMEALQ